jgi:hypothetical protein
VDDVNAIWALVERGGLLFVFFSLAVGQAWAYYKKWVVPGWILVERNQRIAALETEVVQWRTLALQSIGLSSRFASVALPIGGAPPSQEGQ